MGFTFKPGPLQSLTEDPLRGLQLSASLHRVEEAVDRSPEFSWFLEPSGQRTLLLFGDLHMMLGIGSVVPYLDGGQEEFEALTSLDVLYHVFESFESQLPAETIGEWWGANIEAPLWEAAKLRNFATRLHGGNPTVWPTKRGVMRAYAIYSVDRQYDETMVANIVNAQDYDSHKLVVALGEACTEVIRRIDSYLNSCG